MTKNQAGMRESIAEFLPRALETAIASYHQFAEEQATVPAPEKPEGGTNMMKSFKDHHDACKVALAHIELLIKLAKWAELPDPAMEDAAKQERLQAMINVAQAELDG